jgi:CxxC motif-containing protein (DUF1111 family)
MSRSRQIPWRRWWTARAVLGAALVAPSCTVEHDRPVSAERAGPPAARGASVAKRRVALDLPSTPLRGATDAERVAFRNGDELFEAVVREGDGLGPLYIRDSCVACHAADARGPGLVTKMVVSESARGHAADLLPYGPTERPYVAGSAELPLVAPEHELVSITVRQPPAVFGRGYLEAIAESELYRLELEARERTGSIRGRLHRLPDGRIGRFGIKARLATVRAFTADALNGDMGITTPDYPAEPPGPEGLLDDKKPGVDFSSEQVTLLSDYVRLLEIPDRKPATARGRELFQRASCATCHVPSLLTESAFDIPALAGIRADVYTDLLLHDMGLALSDGQTEGNAGPREYRTSPLVGVRFMTTFLHDGRARDVEQAILAHGAPDSEGRDSVAVYVAMPENDRRELIRFVEAL